MIIVNFHNIVDRPPNALNTLVRKEWDTLADFERQIAELRAQFRIVSLEEMVEAIRSQERIPRACSVTFDDGYVGTYKYGLPVLERHSITATCFVVTRRIDADNSTVPDQFDRLEAMLRLTTKRVLELSEFGYGTVSLVNEQQKAAFYRDFARRIKVTGSSVGAQIQDCIQHQLGVSDGRIRDYRRHEAYQMMTWDQADDLRNRGWTVGSHTRTHPSLSQIDEHGLDSEIQGSFSDLKQRLGLNEMPFAYPFGNRQHISDAAIAAVRRAGYGFAVTMIKGKNKPGSDVFQLRRMSFHRAIRVFRDAE